MRLTFRLKTPWSDGTTHLLLSPLGLIEKLAVLVPPRRLNLVRYHGILAPNARYRSQVVPDSPAPAVSTAPDASAPSIYPHRFTWAALLARVFAVDVTVCPACGGPLRLIAVLSDPASDCPASRPRRPSGTLPLNPRRDTSLPTGPPDWPAYPSKSAYAGPL